MNINDCLKEGLLAKAKPDREMALSSIKMAEHKLGIAEKEFGHGLFESAIISAYSSMFHAARALLFKDGYKERSHFAVYAYLSEKYSGKIEKRHLSELNALRLQRHDLMYGLEKALKDQQKEAEYAIENARGFIGTAKKIVE